MDMKSTTIFTKMKKQNISTACFIIFPHSKCLVPLGPPQALLPQKLRKLDGLTRIEAFSPSQHCWWLQHELPIPTTTMGYEWDINGISYELLIVDSYPISYIIVDNINGISWDINESTIKKIGISMGLNRVKREKKKEDSWNTGKSPHENPWRFRLGKSSMGKLSSTSLMTPEGFYIFETSNGGKIGPKITFFLFRVKSTKHLGLIKCGFDHLKCC
jgi:hypothetical protein